MQAKDQAKEQAGDGVTMIAAAAAIMLVTLRVRTLWEMDQAGIRCEEEEEEEEFLAGLKALLGAAETCRVKKLQSLPSQPRSS